MMEPLQPRPFCEQKVQFIVLVVVECTKLYCKRELREWLTPRRETGQHRIQFTVSGCSLSCTCERAWPRIPWDVTLENLPRQTDGGTLPR